ncbi:MAG: ROK family protein [Clostridiales bacterium]|nr:ROK family protein [Clostridiales bacterium]
MKKYVIAIDAGGTFFKSAIVSSEAEILDGSMLTVPANNDASPDIVREGYRYTLTEQLKTAKSNGIEISAVAIDTPGPFDYEGGFSMMEHKFKAIYKIPLRLWIEEIAGKLPITFIHDSAAFLSGEMWHSPYVDSNGREYKNAAGVMIGTGLGFATMKDGKVLRKPDGSPLYSIWAQTYGDKIAEDYISGRGIAARYTKAEKTAKEIEELAKSGDEEALKVYADTGRILAEVTAPYLELIGAEILVLGGQISRGLPLFEKELTAGLQNVKTLKRITRSERLEISHMLGAANDCFNKCKLF